MIDKINHENLAISRLATEYSESPNLIEYIKLKINENQTLENVYCDLLTLTNLDVATGVNLDILGSIVGQPREFIDASIFKYFGLASNSQAQSFGTVSDPNIGGRFVAVDEPTTGIRKLNDDEYRTFIRARIARNSTRATREDIISMIGFIFNAAIVHIVEFDTFYQVNIGSELTLNEKALLTQTDIVPKPAGVGASYVTQFDSNNFFAFQGVANGEGFGSLTDPNVGGKFGHLL